MTLALQADRVSKRFVLHTATATSLKELVLKGGFARSQTTTFDALHDVSFDLPMGRSLAIVGANGSGKSTLLKLVAGIGVPSGGRLAVRGRVAALLELGAGFQLELTGMENIFLQGSLLGMSRAQILARLDKVLDFCELGPFVHTPMKRYSSGMIVRLGFALAVFSDAETLLVDEVLAVGDAAFQAKCFRRIAEFRAEGRTILFVSHFVPQVELVADDVLWLDQGRVVAHGSLDDVLPNYVEALLGPATGGDVHDVAMDEVDWTDERRSLVMASSPRGVRLGGGDAIIEEVALLDEQGRRTTVLHSGRPCTIEVRFTARRRIAALQVELGYAGLEGLRMGWQGTELQGLALRDIEGRHTVRARVASLPFLPGRYRMSVALSNPTKSRDYFDVHYEAYAFQVRGRRDVENVSATLPPGRFVARPVS